MDRLDSRVAFITGGASGIGLALARRCAREGMRVAVADVEAPALDRAAAELREHGDAVLTLAVDVTSRDDLQQALTRTVEAFGAVNLLCNNAGVNAAGPVESLSFRDWDWVLGVNLGGVVNGVVTFLPELLRHAGAAHIVNTASVGGLLGMAGLAPYNASKFAVVGLSEALRADLAGRGVGVSVLCPGVVRTNLASSERNRPEALRDAQGTPPGAVGDGDDPMSGGMDPEDVAAAVIDAVRENRFFVCTHGEFAPLVEARNEVLLKAFPAQASEEAMAFARSLVPDLG